MSFSLLTLPLESFRFDISILSCSHEIRKSTRLRLHLNVQPMYGSSFRSKGSQNLEFEPFKEDEMAENCLPERLQTQSLKTETLR
eukprot:757757-Hanusia_phi.AAC.3